MSFAWLWLQASWRPNLVSAARISGEDGVSPTVSEKAAPVPSQPTAQKIIKKAPASNSAQGSEKRLKPQSEKPPPRKPAKRPKPDEEDTRVTIDFDQVELPIFVKFISELTGKNFVIDKGVRGKVTIVSPNKISVDEAYKVFESVLDVHGFTTVPSGSIIKIVPAVNARTMNVETRLKRESTEPDDQVITQLIPLRYADPDELKKLFTPFISKSSVMVSYPPTRTLIVTDVQSNIQRLLNIARAIDVEGVGEEIAVLPLEYAVAENLAKSLNTVFERRAVRRKTTSDTDTVTKIVADERTNSLIVVAAEDDVVKIRNWRRFWTRKPLGARGISTCFTCSTPMRRT